MSTARCVIITNGVVTNVVVTDPTKTNVPGSVVVASATAQIGDSYASGVFTPAPPPPPQTTGLNFLQFMALLTQAEQVALISSADPQVKLFVAQAEGAPALDLTDARVSAGLNYCASLGLLTTTRVAKVLTGSPP